MPVSPSGGLVPGLYPGLCPSCGPTNGGPEGRTSGEKPEPEGSDWRYYNSLTYTVQTDRVAGPRSANERASACVGSRGTCVLGPSEWRRPPSVNVPAVLMVRCGEPLVYFLDWRIAKAPITPFPPNLPQAALPGAWGFGGEGLGHLPQPFAPVAHRRTALHGQRCKGNPGQRGPLTHMWCFVHIMWRWMGHHTSMVVLVLMRGLGYPRASATTHTPMLTYHRHPPPQRRLRPTSARGAASQTEGPTLPLPDT